jgi:hypothetical protein
MASWRKRQSSVALLSLLLMTKLETYSNAQSTTSDVVVAQFEYQLEVEESSTQKELAKIDSNILGSLQTMLPNAGMTASSKLIPNVEFVDVQSIIYSQCFTESEQCSLVRSNILIHYEGEKPEYSVERVAYRLIQQYLEEYTAKSNGTVVMTYLYPFLVSDVAQFQLAPVYGAMSNDEIQVMEETFLEVIGATVMAMEGDTEIQDVNFIYQDLLTMEPDIPLTLSAFYKIYGVCRQCSHDEFSGLVNTVVSANLEAYENKLQKNGAAANTTYFDRVDNVTYTVPKLPKDLSPIDDDSIYDEEPPQTTSTLPWFLALALCMASCIILSGIYVICKDLRDLEDEKAEEEFSTASESEMGYSENESDGEISSTAGYIEKAGQQASLEEYQVETVLSDDYRLPPTYKYTTRSQGYPHSNRRTTRKHSPRPSLKNNKIYSF